jgi:hypothetical protein
VYKKFDITPKRWYAPRTKRWLRLPLYDTAPDPSTSALLGKPALSRQFKSRLGACVVDAYLKHWKTALQFDRAVFRAFPGAELVFRRPLISMAKPDLGNSIVRFGILHPLRVSAAG